MIMGVMKAMMRIMMSWIWVILKRDTQKKVMPITSQKTNEY